MDELTYRLLGAGDIEAYVAIRREMLEDAPWSFLSSPEEFTGDTDEILARMSGERAIAGALVGGRLRGVACVSRQSRVKVRHRASITGVYVGPEVRGRGVGRRVMELAIETARAWEGVEIVGLSVSAGAIAARRLYESLGFVAWGVEADAIRIDGVSRDEIHMQLRMGE